jgi:hypothetical protein
LASSIVQGHFAEQHVPFHIRNLILAESGANDGLGYPFLFLAVYLLQMPVGQAIGKWFYWILAFQILLSIVIGFVVGFVARKALKFAEQKQLIDKESFLVFAVALAVSSTEIHGYETNQARLYSLPHIYICNSCFLPDRCPLLEVMIYWHVLLLVIPSPGTTGSERKPKMPTWLKWWMCYST